MGARDCTLGLCVRCFQRVGVFLKRVCGWELSVSVLFWFVSVALFFSPPPVPVFRTSRGLGYSGDRRALGDWDPQQRLESWFTSCFWDPLHNSFPASALRLGLQVFRWLLLNDALRAAGFDDRLQRSSAGRSRRFCAFGPPSRVRGRFLPPVPSLPPSLPPSLRPSVLPPSHLPTFPPYLPGAQSGAESEVPTTQSMTDREGCDEKNSAFMLNVRNGPSIHSVIPSPRNPPAILKMCGPPASLLPRVQQ